MGDYVFTNYGRTTLASNLVSGATSASVVDGGVFPSTGDFMVVVNPAGPSRELCKVTARSGNTLTIQREQEGTSSPAQFDAGSVVALVLTKGILDWLSAAIAANTSARHTQNTDTALGAQSQSLNMNTHKIVGLVDPTSDQEAATKKYVDDHTGGSFYVYTTFLLTAPDDPLTTGTDVNAVVVEAPCALTIVEVRAVVKTAPTGAAIVCDVNKNGTSIWDSTQANRVTIAASATEGNQTSFDTTALAKGDNLTLDIDQVGSSEAGEYLAVEVICSQAVSS